MKTQFTHGNSKNPNKHKRANQEAVMDAKSNKSRYELTVELIKALIWPVFAFVILFSFWRPLQSTMDQLPDIVSRSDTITIAGLSLKIERNLQLQGKEPSLEVKDALSKLTPDDISALLDVTSGVCYIPSSAEDAKVGFEHLIALGLFKEISVESFKTPECVYAAEVTDLGKETQKYLYVLIAEFVQQLNSASSNSIAVPVQTP